MSKVAPDRGEPVAVVVGTLLGTVLVWGALRVGLGPTGVGAVVGLAGFPGWVLGWAGAATASLAATAGYGAVLGRATTPFVNHLFSLTRRSDRLRSLLLPVVTDHGYVAAALTIGTGYGLALGVALGVGIPVAHALAVGGGSLPVAAALGLLGWTAYGAGVGVSYAVLTDRS